MTPPSLPPYIFLMSDHTTAKLAAEVADALSTKYPHVYVDDFLAPIYEGFAAMFELDWKRDMGNPDEVNRIFLPAGEQTERDIIVSLEKWFIEQFGEKALGMSARQRCDARNEMADYVTVFRDATAKHLEGFGPCTYQSVNLDQNQTVDWVVSFILNPPKP